MSPERTSSAAGINRESSKLTMETKKKMFRCDVSSEECKGCGRCVVACPRGLLEVGSKLNKMSFPYAIYKGEGCIGCGGCFYTCPEPGAITIVELVEE